MLKRGEVEVSYNYGRGAEYAAEKIKDNPDADVIYIETRSWYMDENEIISISIDQAEILIGKLNSLLYDIYEARNEQ